LNTSTVLIAVLAALALGLGVYVAFLLAGKKSTLEKARADARAEAEKATEILQSSRKEAANILNVSRPFLVRLLDRGEIPFHRVGTHRRLRVEDVLAYREQRAAARRAKLAELTRLSQDVEGGYR